MNPEPSGRGDLPEGDEKRRAVRSMFDAIAPRYDLVNRVMTFRLDVRWRRRAVSELGLPAGSLVADLACGTGDFCREVDAAGLRSVGFDLSRGMLAAARTDAPLVEADILTLPVGPGRFDGITCGFALRNVVDLGALFAEMARVTRAGGRLALLEVSEPSNPLLRRGHAVYFGRVVPFVGGLLSDRDAYRYLPRSVAYLPPHETIAAMLGDAGFTSVSRRALTTGAAQLVTATRR